MLGSIASKNFYATSNSISVLPRVVAEWNGNSYGEPYTYGVGSSTVTTSTAPSSLDVFSGTPSVAPVKTTGGGQYGDLYKITYVATEGETNILSTSSSQPVYSFSYTNSSANDNQALRLSFFAYTENSPATISVIIEGYNSDETQVIDSKSYSIDIYQSTPKAFNLDLFNYDNSKYSSIAKVKVKFITSYVKNPQRATTPNLLFYIDSPQFYRISRFNAKNNNVIPMQSPFSKVYAGEAFVDADLYGNSVLTNNASVSPYYIAFSANKLESSGTTSYCRNFLPSQYSKFKYLIIDSSVYSNVFARYKNMVRTNKIVMKVNPLGQTPTSISLKLLTESGGTYSWTTQTVSSSAFSNNGLLVLYYNGSSWSTTAWESIPKMVNGELDGTNSYVDIYGINVEFSGAGGLDSTQKEIHLVEVSPRFQVDLSNYVLSFDMSKELSNDNLPLPIGIANSNTANISFSNIPDRIDGVDVFPFSNDSSNPSLLKNLIDKNVKMNISIEPNGGGITESCPISTVYTSNWKSGFDMTSVAECFDLMKFLTLIFPPVMYRKSVSPTSIVADILDSVGVTDYDYNQLMSMELLPYSSTIDHFWTVRDKTVLDTIQEVLLPYQISMYVDEYGVIKFQSLSTIITNSNSTPDFIATDSYFATGSKYSDGITDKNFESNIMSYDENIENRPAEISVGYTTVAPKTVLNAPNGSLIRGFESVWKAPSGSLGYIVLSKNLSYKDSELSYYNSLQDYIKNGYKSVNTNNVSYIESFSGYLVIDQEIVGFNGKKYKITTANNATGITYIINSKEELDSITNQLVLKTKSPVTVTDLNILCNLTRGMFGTTPANHNISDVASTLFSQYVDNDTSKTRASSSGRLTEKISSYGAGIALAPLNSTNIDRTIAMFNTATQANSRIYTLTFKLLQAPAAGKPMRVGMVIGADKTNRNGRFVELIINTHKMDNDVVTDSVVRTFRMTTSDKFDDVKHYFYRSYYKKVKNKKKQTVQVRRNQGDKMDSLNLDGTNTLTVVLSSDNKNMAVFVNGDVVTWSGIPQVKYIKATFKSTTNSQVGRYITIPSNPLDSAVTTSGKYFGVYADGPSSVLIQGVQAFPLEYKDSFGTAEMIATVAYGNQFGISNKNELDAVLHGRYEADLSTPLGYTPTIVGREVKVFDFDYEQAPVTDAVLNRVVSFIVPDGKNQTKIPSESIAASSFYSDVLRSRFALMNAYTAPVNLNYQDTATSKSSLTTYINGSVLQPKYKKFVSINQGGSNEQTVRLDSEWIQSEVTARNVLSIIHSSLIMKKSNLSVEIFGNPLIQIGDIVGFRYDQKGIPLKNYVVTSVNLGYNNGIITKLTLRRVQE